MTIGQEQFQALGAGLFVLLFAVALLLWFDPRGADFLSELLSRRAFALKQSRNAYKTAWDGCRDFVQQELVLDSETDSFAEILKRTWQLGNLGVESIEDAAIRLSQVQLEDVSDDNWDKETYKLWAVGE